MTTLFQKALREAAESSTQEDSLSAIEKAFGRPLSTEEENHWRGCIERLDSTNMIRNRFESAFDILDTSSHSA